MFIWELFSLLALFVLRIGVPLALVALLTWWLARLDRKWQSQPPPLPIMPAQTTAGTDEAKSSADRPIIQVPCWVFRACPPECRAKCRVYQAANTTLPCWRIHLAQDGRLPAGCRTCAIFATTARSPAAAGAD